MRAFQAVVRNLVETAVDLDNPSAEVRTHQIVHLADRIEEDSHREGRAVEDRKDFEDCRADTERIEVGRAAEVDTAVDLVAGAVARAGEGS